MPPSSSPAKPLLVQESLGSGARENAARLQSQIDSYRAQIEKLFAEHPDHDLLGSLPGAGPKIAPGEMGLDRSRFE